MSRRVPNVQTIDQREEALLARYALRNRDSRGREYPEQEHSYRGVFQRDRDRVLHCSAFRRLAHKMQVFTGDMGDYHRSRLTHTMEVASIARTIGRALRLNEDLIEALALLHDLGHPPFGHIGEQALDACLADIGGFSHNAQALTIIRELEVRQPEYAGLNLTFEVLEGQADRSRKEDPAAAAPLLEVQVVDMADSITYDAHDTDDAVQLGLVSVEELAETELIAETLREVRKHHGEVEDELLRKLLVRTLIDRQVSRMLRRCAGRLDEASFSSAAEVCESGFRLDYGPELTRQKNELERFLHERVYRHPMLIEVREQAAQQMKTMFEGLAKQSELLPPPFHARIAHVGVKRAVGDYLACLTDRACTAQYEQHFARIDDGS